MMGNSFGQQARLTIFGESHGAAIGAVLDGLPAGIAIDWDRVRFEMARRAPGGSDLSTPRREADAFEVESGYFEGHTTGTPMAVLIKNTDGHSGDYSLLRNRMRPGHADYTAQAKYGGFQDYRGGGHFSGRLTAPLVFAGAIAMGILEQRGIYIGAHAAEVAGVRDRSWNPCGEGKDLMDSLRKERLPVLDREAGKRMEDAIISAGREKDSVGGVIECMVCGLPAGLGDPFFDSAESGLAHMMFSIPAVKGIEFGDGFGLAEMKGSEANDAIRYGNSGVVFETNHNGGILGGITSGAPLLFRVAVKPTASIGKKQRTIDISLKENAELEIRGRHDPCIVPRAIPVVEAAAAWTLLDLLLTDRSF